MRKKLLCILLASVMLFSVAGCGQSKESASNSDSSAAASSQTVSLDSGSSAGSETSKEEGDSAYPEWLNLDAYYPLVAEGTDITLDVVIIDIPEFTEKDVEDRYMYKFIEQIMNVDLNVTQISSDGATEYINMMFASDTVPDLLFTSQRLTPEQLVTYGMQEGQLLDFAPFVNDSNLMPALNSVFEEEPTLKANMTAPDGGIYTQVLVADRDAVGNLQRRTVNVDMLKEAGITSLPTTLDEYVEAMYAVKKAFPDSTPVGGAYDSNNAHGIILNALGINDSAKGGKNGLYDVAVRNDAATVPAADREVWEQFLTLMNQFFNDGIINRDYFTMEGTASQLLIEDGKSAVWTGWINPLDYDNLEKYEQLPALTSDYCSEAFVGHPTLYTIGGCVASAKTEYPELIARICDYFYTMEGNNLCQGGPFTTQEHLMIEGHEGIVMNDANQMMFVSCIPKEGNYDFGAQEVQDETRRSMLCTQAIGYKYGQIPYRQEIWGREEIKTDYDNWKASEQTANSFWRCDAYDTYMPVREIGLPILYLRAEDSTRIAELKSVLEPHMETETIKFITGDRPLSELEEYFKELDDLGYQEYIGYYQTAYESFMENK